MVDDLRMKKLAKASNSREHQAKHQQTLLDYYENESVPQYPEDKMPFFILGSPRSGTTLLRDLLREHPGLDCPEETHFFRWSDPFGSPKYISHYKTRLMKEHREMDKVDDFMFATMMSHAHSREHMAWGYGEWYLRQKGKSGARLYDKTPQNVYGIFLINAVYPTARFIHIYRNPLNVVASLMEGKVMPVHTLRGAINSWVESMLLLDQFKKFKPDLLLEVCYEDLAVNPDPHLKKILEFVGEDSGLLPSQASKTHKEKNKYLSKLSEQEIRVVKKRCEPFYSTYGYNNTPAQEKVGLLKRLLKKI